MCVFLLFLKIISSITFESGNFMYTTISENEVSLTKFISENEINIISIPKEVKFENKTYSIISIGERAFDRLLFSFEIEIPNSIQRIEKRAFQFCEKLEGSLILPDSITFIGEYAFYSCFSLNGELKLPKGLKTIEKGTFMYCGFSGSLILPTKLELIKKGAFEWCKFDGILNLTSSKSLEKISETAFWCCSQFSGDLILPSTLKKIGWRAFYHCSGFSNVFYEGLKNLNDDSDSEVFRGCNFHNIYVSSAYEDDIFCDLVAINNKSDILIDNFYYRINKNDSKSTKTNSNIACVISYSNTCDFSSSIIIKEQILVNETNISVISIGEIAFSYSKFTGNLIIPSTIKTIKERAFYHCEGIIGQLILPNGIEKNRGLRVLSLFFIQWIFRNTKFY
ncbi:hypothetical protein TRFO_22430 [Tritrichomonas foetus]|uniref:Surface antigen BspA-like n=1 Tax=Tritrichomonas foetus TaxID=1144522 RepID=A0A1J4KBY1_9EUKA|nr:hypothetical protein TRFO_22430 [Tritrichomonas foetus]|eukprot:OHT08919.1 hypothetical protein TRFO_22430 [Tritrichomonas foetus]